MLSRRDMPSRMRRAGEVHLRRGGHCEAAMHSMCDVAEQLLETNDGIALASAACFVEVGSAGTLTTVTDASGEDGIGGYAFHPATPGVAWLLADEWPLDVRAALAHAAAPRAERPTARGFGGEGISACSMPLAELFGPWAITIAPSTEAPTVPARARAAASVATANRDTGCATTRRHRPSPLRVATAQRTYRLNVPARPTGSTYQLIILAQRTGSTH